MKLSNKPRHWVALVIAIVSLILSLMILFDFSGDPIPKWLKIGSGLRTTLTVVFITMNLALDRKGKEE